MASSPPSPAAPLLRRRAASIAGMASEVEEVLRLLYTTSHQPTRRQADAWLTTFQARLAHSSLSCTTSSFFSPARSACLLH